MLVVTDLNNNSEPLIDYTDLKRKRRINSEKTISFTTFPSEKNGDAIHLVEVESKVEFDGDVYVIKSCEVVADGDSYYKVVSATMKFYVDLIGKQQPLIKNGSLTFVDALNFVFGGTDYTYTINGTFYAQEFENLGNTNRLALLSTIIDRYKAEFIVVNNNAFFYEQVGTETDIAFRYAKNITGLNRPSNSNDLATIITGTGANIGTEESPKYIKATYESPNVEKFGPIEADPIHDERFTTVESLTNHLKEILQDEPVISLQVNIAILEEQEISDLDEGDYIYLIYEPFDDLEVYVRVVELDEYFDVNGDLVDADITLANYQESLAAVFTDSVDVKLSEERKVITNIIQQTADGKNSIYRGPNEPQGDHLKEGDLWYQPTGDGETKMYQYTGTHWELILDTAKTSEISNKVDEAFQDAQSAIDAAANAQLRADQANHEAEQALTQAQTSFDTAQNALIQSNNAFASVEALSTRVDEQTGEISTIKQSVSGLQTAVANVEGDISTLTQVTNSIKADVKSVDGRVSTLSVSVDGITTRVTNAEGNISTLTQTTSGLQTRVANAEGNISTLTQTASALQTRMTNAEGNISTLTQTATSLTSRIDNLKVGGRNYLLNTSPELFSLNNWFPYGASYMQLFKSGDYLAVKCTVDNSSATVGVYSGANQNPNVTCYLNEWYTLSFDAYLDSAVSVNNLELNYIYIMSKVGNFSISASGYGAVIITKEKKRVSISFKINSGSVDRTPVGILIGTRRLTLGDIFYIKNIKLEKGNMATDWSPAPEDTDSEFDAVYSQITQLNNNINLKVSKNDVVNQINVSTEGILIDGSKVHITGTTTIDNGVIKSAMIASLSADKITAGTLNAATVNVINLNASSIVSGTLNANSVVFGNNKIRVDSTGLYVYKNSVLGASLVEGNLTFNNQTTGSKIGMFAATVWEGSSYTGISMNVENSKYISFGHYENSTLGYISMLTIAPTAFAGVPQGINTGLDLRLGRDLWAGAWAIRFGRNNTHNHSTIWHVDDNLAMASYGILRLGTLSSGAVMSDRLTIDSNSIDAYVDLDMHGWTLRRVAALETSNFARVVAVSNMGYLQHDYGISITKYKSTTYAPIAASAFNVASSREFKTNIKELDYSALSVINRLKVVEYDLIANIREGIDDRQVGLIAEDSISVATKDCRAINHYKLTSYLTKAIQEISTIQQNDLLTRAQLELKILTLELEIAKLKEKMGVT